jgi:hypothetical protein
VRICYLFGKLEQIYTPIQLHYIYAKYSLIITNAVAFLLLSHQFTIWQSLDLSVRMCYLFGKLEQIYTPIYNCATTFKQRIV